MAEVAEKVSGVIGRRIRYEDAPSALAAQVMVEKGLGALFADLLTGFYAAVREGGHDVVTGPIAGANHSAATVGSVDNLADRQLSAHGTRTVYSETPSTTLPRAWPCSR